jgi:hypothetical protein
MTRLIAFAVLVLASGIAAADETNAEKLYEQGQVAFDAKRFDEAISAWEQSYELSKEPDLLFNIGQAYRQRGKPGDCTKAFTSYQKFIELAATSEQRPVAEGFAVELKACAIHEAPAPIAAPIAVPSPTPIMALVTAPPLIEPSNGTRSGRTEKIAGFTLAGGGVALVATGFYFGHRASSLGNEVTSTCAKGCDWAVYGPKNTDGRSAQTKQYVFDGLGAAAIVGGGIMYWLGTREGAPSIALATHRGGAVVTWSGSW